MYCIKCGTKMEQTEARRNMLKYFGCLTNLGCLVSPLGCLLAPLAFFLPKTKIYVCPKCGHKEPDEVMDSVKTIIKNKL